MALDLFLAFSMCCLSTFVMINTNANPQVSSLSVSTAKPHRFVSKLIHPHSVHHPFYDPNETKEDRIEHDIKRSLARVASLQSRIGGSLASHDQQASLYASASHSTMLANISIGHPPVPQLLVMDTGSPLLWIMCVPCSNCAQYPGQIFNPSLSSTYSPLCNSAPCHYNSSNQFQFNITYADRTFTSGTLALEQLVFETPNEGIEVFKVVFGCGHNFWSNREPGYNGILGLNNYNLALASQTGKKFSYCIDSITGSNFDHSHLIFGEGAYLEGYSTPFEVFDDMYYITMEGISVGEKSINVAPKTFERKPDGTGGVIIDSGSTFSFLVYEGYKVLLREIRSLLDGSFGGVRYAGEPWLLCYLGTVSRDLVGFPVVTFHFAEGADLVLDTESLFIQRKNDTFCMAVAPINVVDLRSKPSIIGLLAQQSYNIGYDLNDKDIYFQRIDCELLSG
ncbi:aspartic proteinase CDR1-like [Prosopis cineraria]|uniref:aspartic proteinase CDR1-like n=1 Tax=Prosopis cineraria TaxID=364024 RepID=UPI00240FF7B2|nr:aspartic proteinase CDR1-like [Prosopis cineraria]